MAAELMAHPAGTVTGVFRTSAAREGAYRSLRSDKVEEEELELTRNLACAFRMAALGQVCLVAIDKTSVQLSDRTGERDYGSVGSRANKARGVQVITAIALDEEGAPLGVLRQVRWARSETPSPPRREGHARRKRVHDPRPAEERESWRWVNVLEDLEEIVEEHAPLVQPWIQIDAEGDFWGIHRLAAESRCYSTIRMNVSHAIREGKEKPRRPMRDWLRGRKVRYRDEVVIPAHDGRPARLAKLNIRYAKAELSLPTEDGQMWVPKWFVFVDEPRAPSSDEKISWVLATTYPVESDDDARRVIEGYTQRWRSEDFHRVWMSGGVDIESSQLHSMKTFGRWAILTSSVAIRTEYIKHYSREYPNAPATDVYSRLEIDEMIRWRRENMPKAKHPYDPGG